MVSSDYSVSSTNNTDHQYIAEILLKVALNTIKQAQKNPNDFYYALNLFQRIFLVPMNILNAPKDIVWPHDLCVMVASIVLMEMTKLTVVSRRCCICQCV